MHERAVSFVISHPRMLAASMISLLILALTACTGIGIGSDNQADVRVIDLNIVAAGPFGWVDNETFVVMMTTGERYTRKDGAEVQIARVATVNYKTKEQRIYGKVSSGLCFADGYVSYIFENDATEELFASFGELGKETVRKIEPGKLTFDGRSCRPWGETGPVLSSTVGRPDVFHLWPKLGDINCNVHAYSLASRSVKAAFHKPGEESGIGLPFSCYDVRRGFQYYAFRGAFFTPEHAEISPWPVGRDRKAYWLYPNGTVETLVLPYSTAIRENMVPTARGILAFGRPAKRGEHYGVYLVVGKDTKQVLRGHAVGVTSPNGCNVAILHDPEFDARVNGRRANAPVNFKVLELC